jgi:isochorismate hydrolase
MDKAEKVQQWLKDLDGFIRHGEIKISDLQSSALIVVDMQNFFIDETCHACVPSAKAILDNVNRLIILYSTLKLPIVFTRYALPENAKPGTMSRWWRTPLEDDSTESELYPGLKVPSGSKIISKMTYDGFNDTNLEALLLENNVDTVVITGVMTHLCCETTARSAFVRNFNVYFVIDGNATINEALHMSTLRNLSDGFAVPVTTAGLIEALEKDLK